MTWTLVHKWLKTGPKFLPTLRKFCFLLRFGVFWCLCYFLFLTLVVSTSAIDCLQRLVYEMTCYVSGGTSDPINSTQGIPSCSTLSQRGLMSWQVWPICSMVSSVNRQTKLNSQLCLSFLADLTIMCISHLTDICILWVFF